MNRRTLWLAVSGMVLSLAMAACAPATVPPTPTQPEASSIPAPVPPATPVPPAPIAPTEEKPQQEAVAPQGGVPTYGGILTIVRADEPTYWDDFYGNHRLAQLHQVQQRLLVGDWARGPSGTGEFNFFSSDAQFNTKTGQLAESWEIFPDGRGVYKIRQGIRYWLHQGSEASRLVNGRELTAEDIAFSLNRLVKTKGSYINSASPQMSASANITVLDKGTLEIRTTPEWGYEAHYFMAFYAYGDTAKEVVSKYGNYENWRNIVGTGPFILTEYVPGSSLTYTRNANYYLKDPAGAGKGNRLPYLDGMKTLIIPDTSTRLAALRTGKIDIGTSLGIDDARNLMKTQLRLKYLQGDENSAPNIAMRLDKPEMPYKDIRVRHALMLATDFDTISKSIMGGLGRVPSWPMVYQAEIADWWLPLKDAPPDVQELYKYNPEKAKQLLKEAGYPNGFKAEIVVNSSGSAIDEVSIFKDMWAKVGVTLTLDPKEPAVYSRIQTARNNTDMIYSSTASMLQWTRGFGNISSNTFANSSLIDIIGPSYIQESRRASQEAWLKGDYAGQAKVSRDLLRRVLYEAWAIPLPQKPIFVFWWPWVNNFYGALNVGAFTGPGYQYIWIDGGLKKSIGY